MSIPELRQFIPAKAQSREAASFHIAKQKPSSDRWDEEELLLLGIHCCIITADFIYLLLSTTAAIKAEWMRQLLVLPKALGLHFDSYPSKIPGMCVSIEGKESISMDRRQGDTTDPVKLMARKEFHVKLNKINTIYPFPQ